jgi:hypothetical protein
VFDQVFESDYCVIKSYRAYLEQDNHGHLSGFVNIHGAFFTLGGGSLLDG